MVDHLQSRVTPLRQYVSLVKVRGISLTMDVQMQWKTESFVAVIISRSALSCAWFPYDLHAWFPSDRNAVVESYDSSLFWRPAKRLMRIYGNTFFFRKCEPALVRLMP